MKIHRLVWSAAAGAAAAVLFIAGFLVVVVPGVRFTAAVLRRLEDTKIKEEH